MKKTIALLIAIALMCTLFVGCASSSTSTDTPATETPAATDSPAATETPAADEAPAADAQTLKIGVVCPQSGSSAISGVIIANSVQMAVDEINANGGINGNIPIELYSEDDESVPATSVTVVQKLVEQDKVNAIIGSQASSCTLANMEVTKAAKIPQITPASSNVTITQQGNPYIFRMTSTDAINAATLLKYCQSKGYTKISMCYDSSDFGTGGYNIVSGLAPDYGIEIVAAEVYNTGDTDFSVILGKMDAAKPDTFFMWGYHTETAAIMTQMRQYGYDYGMVGFGMNSPELTVLGGDAVEGIVFCTAFDAANPDPTVQAFDKKYVEKFKNSYDQNGPQSYDAVYLIADAVERAIADGADWTNGEVLRDYIASAQYEGVTGTTSFDETGEMVKDLMVITIKNGEHEIVNW